AGILVRMVMVCSVLVGIRKRFSDGTSETGGGDNDGLRSRHDNRGAARHHGPMDSDEQAKRSTVAGGLALADLEQRLRRVEDVLAIQELVAEYGPAVDGGETPAAVRHWTGDGVYEFGTGPDEQVRGHEALTALFDGPGHQGIIGGGSAHIVTPPALRIDGDEAWGTGYSILFRFDGEVP